jgi:hypothetical protein
MRTPLPLCSHPVQPFSRPHSGSSSGAEAAVNHPMSTVLTNRGRERFSAADSGLGQPDRSGGSAWRSARVSSPDGSIAAEPSRMICSLRVSRRSEESVQPRLPRTSPDRRAASPRWAWRRAMRRSVFTRSTMSPSFRGRPRPALTVGRGDGERQDPSVPECYGSATVRSRTASSCGACSRLWPYIRYTTRSSSA